MKYVWEVDLSKFFVMLIISAIFGIIISFMYSKETAYIIATICFVGLKDIWSTKKQIMEGTK